MNKPNVFLLLVLLVGLGLLVALVWVVMFDVPEAPPLPRSQRSGSFGDDPRLVGGERESGTHRSDTTTTDEIDEETAAELARAAAAAQAAAEAARRAAEAVTMGPDEETGATVQGIVIDTDTGTPLPGQQVVVTTDGTQWAWSAESFAETRQMLLGMAGGEMQGIDDAIATIDDRRKRIGQKLAPTGTAERAHQTAALRQIQIQTTALREARATWEFIKAVLEHNATPQNISILDAAAGLSAIAMARELATAVNGDRALDTAAMGKPTTLTATTDEAGRFEIHGIPPALYGISASGPEHQSESSMVMNLSPNETATVTLRVAPVGRFRGKVVDPDNVPIAGAQVRLMPVVEAGQMAIRMPGAPEHRGTLPAFMTPDREKPPVVGEISLNELARADATKRLAQLTGATTTDAEGNYTIRSPQTGGQFQVIAWSEYHAEGRSEPVKAKSREIVEVPAIVLQPLTGVKITVIGPIPTVDAETLGAVPMPEIPGISTPTPDANPNPNGDAADATAAPAGNGPLMGALVRVMPEERAQNLRLVEQGWDGVWDTQGLDRAMQSEFGRFIARTDEDGEAWFLPLPPGKYFLRVRKRGYMLSTQQLIEVTPNRVTEITVELALGAEINGRVIDADGRGVANAKISARVSGGDFRTGEPGSLAPALADHYSRDLVPDEDGEWREVLAQWKERAFTTNDFGYFTLRGLPDGTTVDLHVDAVGYLPHIETHVAVKKGEMLEIVLRARSRVEGDVLMADGTPPAGKFQVFLVNADDRRGEETRLAGPNWINEPQNRPPTATSPDGHFVFGDVLPGRYVVEAFDDVSAPSRSDVFEVREGESVTDVKVMLRRGGTVLGTVITVAGEPVANAVVMIDTSAGLANMARFTRGAGAELLDGAAQETARRFSATRSREDGTFVIRNVPAGEYRLLAVHSRYLDGMSDPFRVEEEGEIPGVRVEMNFGGRIIGLALDRAGNPQADKPISLLKANLGGFTRAQTDREGRFEFVGLEPGLYVVYLDIWTGVGQQAVPGKTVRIEGRETVEVTLGGPESGGTHLFVEVTINGEPARTRCTLIGPLMPFRQIQTDASGRFDVPNVHPGEFVLAIADRPGNHMRFRISPSEAQKTVRFEVYDGKLRGRITDAANNPVPGATVVLSPLPTESGLISDIQRNFAIDRQANAAGEYEFPHVGQGRWNVIVRKDGFAMTQSTVTISSGTTEHNIVLHAGGGTLLGKVSGYVNPKSNPLFRGWVSLEMADGTPFLLGQQAHFFRGTTFRFDGLAPGTYNVIVQQEGAVPQRRNGIVIRANETTEMEFTLVQGGDVVVHVTGDFQSFIGEDFDDLRFDILDNGKAIEQVFNPVDFFQTMLNPPAENVNPNTTSFTIRGIPAGNYQLRMQKPGFQTVVRSLQVAPGQQSHVEVQLVRQ